MSPEPITDAIFDLVLDCPVPSLVAFEADWCSHCQDLKPTLERLANDAAGAYRIFTVDTDKETFLTENNRIRGIPTCLIFKDGKESTRIIGAGEYDDYKRALLSTVIIL